MKTIPFNRCKAIAGSSGQTTVDITSRLVITHIPDEFIAQWAKDNHTTLIGMKFDDIGEFLVNAYLQAYPQKYFSCEKEFQFVGIQPV